MPTNYDYNEQFKDRLKALPLWAGLFAIVFLINKGVWALDKVIVMCLFIAFVPIKLLAITFRSWQLWMREGKKAVFLLLFFLFLFSALIFDFETIPKLLAYSSGEETKANVIELFITDVKNSHFVIYEFSVNNEVFKKQQLVSATYYETLSPGTVIPVHYLQQNPKVSFLTDLDDLKFETMGTLFLGFGIFASLYANEIKDKITSIIKNGFHSRKPA